MLEGLLELLLVLLAKHIPDASFVRNDGLAAWGLELLESEEQLLVVGLRELDLHELPDFLASGTFSFLEGEQTVGDHLFIGG